MFMVESQKKDRRLLRIAISGGAYPIKYLDVNREAIPKQRSTFTPAWGRNFSGRANYFPKDAFSFFPSVF
jgi:hypothetical protein